MCAFVVRITVAVRVEDTMQSKPCFAAHAYRGVPGVIVAVPITVSIDFAG